MSEVNRRELTFSSFDDVISDIEQLANGESHTTGQHSFAKIVQHLALTNEIVIGNKLPPKLPWYMRLAMPLLKSSILNGPVTPGFNLPAKMEAFFWGNEVELPEAITNFKNSVAAHNEKGPLPVHPVFGKATMEQIDSMVLKHAAMHLGFVHPKS